MANSIRRARVADVRALAEIHIAGWRAAYQHIFPPEDFAALIVPFFQQNALDLGFEVACGDDAAPLAKGLLDPSGEALGDGGGAEETRSLEEVFSGVDAGSERLVLADERRYGGDRGLQRLELVEGEMKLAGEQDELRHELAIFADGRGDGLVDAGRVGGLARGEQLEDLAAILERHGIGGERGIVEIAVEGLVAEGAEESAPALHAADAREALGVVPEQLNCFAGIEARLGAGRRERGGEGQW